ncbi:MAG: carboxymuconolactone decarboxylase family protein [Sphingobacteriales bacterium]|nr:MAG: carboxymuconolactone decarboxylase family protein [Sphingobacteriales bacterium]
MEQRLQIDQLMPESWKAMYTLAGSQLKTNLSHTLRELIKIRASQINGCAYCLDMHTKDALKYGETQQRLFLLNAWKETSLFTDEEKAVLAITEEVTLISQRGLSEATYQNARKYFDEETIAQIIMAVVTINAWNRIAISSLTQVPQ